MSEDFKFCGSFLSLKPDKTDSSLAHIGANLNLYKFTKYLSPYLI